MSGFEDIPYAAEIQLLMEEGFIDGMVHVLRNKHPGMQSEIEDAVANAVSKIVTRTTNRPIKDLRGYLYTAAHNGLMDAFRRVERLEEYEPGIHGEPGALPDHEVLEKEEYRSLQRIVSQWPNRNLRGYALLFLDALFYGEPLTAEDAAEQLSHAFGETVNVNSVGQWKGRAIKKLIEEYTTRRFGDHPPDTDRNDR